MNKIIFKNNCIAEEIINYLYSGKNVQIYNHKSWEECIK